MKSSSSPSRNTATVTFCDIFRPMPPPRPNSQSSEKDRRQSVKCVIWDLDNTLWQGVLLEDDSVHLRGEALEVIKTLDSRGILHSIASRSNYEKVIQTLDEFGLREYFIYPQIGWNSKVLSIETIVRSINIGLDAAAFIDDDPFEREEVSFSHPEVLCIDASDLGLLTAMPEMMPGLVTQDSKMRRLMYLADMERRRAEEQFVGPREEFLATLNMACRIAPVQEGDLERVEELMVRTHQLNTTGYTYSYEELNRFCQSGRHKLLIVSLNDKYGSYGRIGLALIECEDSLWTIKLLLMSCRVASRGVGTILVNYIMRQAREQGAVLRAEFVPNGRNRMMYVTYKFAGFKESDERGPVLILESDLTCIQACPDYVRLE